METYNYSEFDLGFRFWSHKVFTKLRAKSIIFNEFKTDDDLPILDTNNDNLDLLSECGAIDDMFIKTALGYTLLRRNWDIKSSSTILFAYNNKSTLLPEKRTSVW
jgi:hypothetical protein